ncbi:MAG: hypothetical protein LC642_06905 [Verrucomicrobiaceae bacterium]|nr:hypothetical protein [Verrucomicrobiaceae bacterium]
MDQRLRWGERDDAMSYDGPHLAVYGRAGMYGSASVVDPITIAVGSRSFVMSAADIQAVAGRFVDLIPVHSMRGSFTYVLAII